MSFNNFTQKVNKFFKKAGGGDLKFCSKFQLAEFEGDFLMKVKPEKCALRILANEGTGF